MQHCQFYHKSKVKKGKFTHLGGSSVKAFLNAFVEVRLRIASGSEFQQSTDLYRKDESKWLVADMGFWIKGVEWREEARGK